MITQFENTSILTGTVSTMNLNCSEKELGQGFNLRAGGALIQDAFPMLNSEEREFILSGITPEEWAKMENGTI